MSYPRKVTNHILCNALNEGVQASDGGRGMYIQYVVMVKKRWATLFQW